MSIPEKEAAPAESRRIRQLTQPRRGLHRTEAAIYIGVSPRKFDELVDGGLMPKPKTIGSRRIWDLRKLDASFDDLAGDDDVNPWD